MSVAEVAQKLGVTEKTITRWCQSGKLPAISKPFGKKITYQISPQVLDMFILAEAEEAKQKQEKQKASKPHSDYAQFWVNAMSKGLLTGKVYSQRTIDDYKHYVDLYFKKQKTVSVSGLQKELLQVPAENFAKREHYYKAILCFARFLIRESALEEQFLQEMAPLCPKRHLPPKRVTVSPEDIERLLDVCQTVDERLIVILLADTGLRVSEACDLTWPDINLEQATLLVRCGKGGKQRRVGLSKRLIEALVAYKATLKTSSSMVFLNNRKKPMVASGLFQRLQRLGKTAGVVVSPHALRRAFVTINANKGRPLQMLQMACGHSDIQTTRKYCLTSESEVIDAMKEWN